MPPEASPDNSLPPADSAGSAPESGMLRPAAALAREGTLGVVLLLLLRVKGLVTTKLMALAWGPEGMGLYSLLSATGSLLWPLVGLNLIYATNTYLPHESDPQKRRALYGFHLSFAMLCALPLTALSCGILISSGVFTFWQAAALGLYLLVFQLDLLSRAWLQAGQRVGELAVYDSLCQLLSFALLCVVLLLRWPPEVALTALLTGILFSVIRLQRRIIREGGLPTLRMPPHFARHLLFGLATAPLGLLMWGMQSADYYLVEYYMGQGELGIYGLCYALTFSLAGVISLLHSMLYPALAAHWSAQGRPEEKQECWRIAGRYYAGFLSVGAAAFLGMCSLAPVFIQLISTPAFATAAGIFPYICGSLLLHVLNTAPRCVLELEKRASFLLLGQALALALNIGLNLLWIPQRGLEGAAQATLVSYLLLFVIFWLGQGLPLAQRLRHLAKTATVFLVCAGHGYIMIHHATPFYIIPSALVAAALLGFYEYRSGIIRLTIRRCFAAKG